MGIFLQLAAGFLLAACPGGAATIPDKVTVVDMLAVYTSDARNAAGGTNSMEALLQQAFLEANSVFQNSRAQVRVRLVKHQEVSYAESGSVTTDLERLRDRNDGWLDQVHAWRETAGADLVCLITETGNDWDFYGLQGPSAANAFSILRRPFLVSYNYLPVALSFNFGCQLDRPNADSVAAYPFSFGHTFYVSGTAFGTVEGFSSSIRLPWFSNPEILHQGAPSGVPAGQAYAADNTRTLNLTAPIIAAFRGGAVSTLPPTVTLVSPTTNAVTSTASNLVITASAQDPDGFVTRVGFFANGQYLGSAQGLPFTVTVTNPASGPHRLIALAIDDKGATSVSEPVEVFLLPGNDNFAQRAVLTGESLDVSADTWRATTEPGEPGLGDGRSLWWSWNAPGAGVVQLSLPDGWNAMELGVFTGELLVNLVPVASAGGWQLTRVPVLAGQALQIKAHDSPEWGDSTHPFTLLLRFAPKPPNDDFADAANIAGTNLNITAEAAGASHEPGEPFSAGHSVWWTWAAPRDGGVVVGTTYTNAQFAQWIGVFTGDTLTNLTGEGSSFAGSVAFRATAGTAYRIAVDGSGDPFTLTLQLSGPPANDNFADAMLLSGTQVSMLFTTLGATVEVGEPEHFNGVPSSATVWFRWFGPAEGVANIYYPASVAIYTGTALSNLVKVAQGQQTPVSFAVSSGRTYWIAISETSGLLVEPMLGLDLIQRAPNDNFANRLLLLGEFATVRGSNQVATLEPGEVTGGGATVWWTWTAPRSGPVTLQGSFSMWWDPIPLITVFTGDSISNLTLVTSNNIPSGLLSYLTFQASAGTSYQISMAGNAGLQGDLILTLDMSDFRIISPTNGTVLISNAVTAVTADASGIPDTFERVEFYDSGSLIGTASQSPFTIPWTNAWLGDHVLSVQALRSNEVVRVSIPTRVRITPPNDDFANATILTGENFHAEGDSHGATWDSGFPQYTAESIWWRWAAPTGGLARLRFTPGHAGITLRVFTGTNLAGLSFVVEPNYYNRTVVFPVVAGQVCYFESGTISVGGWVGLDLELFPYPANDDFADATVVTTMPFTQSVRTLAATSEPGEPVHGGFASGSNSVWWQWTAPAAGRVEAALVHGYLRLNKGLGGYFGNSLSNLLPVIALPPLTGGYFDRLLSFEVAAGQVVHFAADQPESALPEISFHPMPMNDNFADRQTAVGTAVVLTGDNFLATRESVEANHGGISAGKSLWWTWTAPADGVLRLNSARSTAKPVMAVYTGDSVFNLVLLAATPQQPQPDYFIGVAVETNLAVEVIQGVAYAFVVDAPRWTSGGEFAVDLSFTSLRLTQPGTDVAYLAPKDMSIAGAFVDALDGPLSRLDFFAGTNFIGSGSSPGFDFVWSNAPPGRHSVRAVATNATGGILESYPRQIAIGLSPNDAFASRILLAGGAGQLAGNNVGATREPGERPLSGALGQTLWWSWIAPANGSVVLSIPTNAAFHPVLGVFTGAGLTNLSLVASNSYQECDNSFFGGCWWRQREQLAFDVVVGTTYFITVDGYTHEVCTGGVFTLNGEFNVAFNFRTVPANDAFAARTVLAGGAVMVTNVNLGATRELGEPAHAGNTNARSIWYQWTPPFSGRARISGEAIRIPQTPAIAGRGSSVIIIFPPEPCSQFSESPPIAFLQPVWSVYSGSDLTNLTPIAAGVDIQFDAIAGQPVNIAVTGPGDSSGAFVMRLQLAPRPANDNFASRLPLVTTSLAATNSGATREPGELGHGFGTNQFRSVWWTWTAPASGTVRIRALAYVRYWTGFWWDSYVAELCVRAYLGSALTSLVPVTSQDYFGEATFYAQAGATYQIAVVTGLPGIEYDGEFYLYAEGLPPPPQVDALNSRREPDGVFRLGIAGQTGQSFVLQASSDLLSWENIATDTVLGSLAQIVDADATRHPHRFYRAVPLGSLLARQPLEIRNFALSNNSGFVLKLQGNPGEGYLLQASTNLVDWIQLGSGLIFGNSSEFTDPDSFLFPARFYRLLPVP